MIIRETPNLTTIIREKPKPITIIRQKLIATVFNLLFNFNYPIVG